MLIFILLHILYKTLTKQWVALRLFFSYILHMEIGLTLIDRKQNGIVF